MPSLAAPASFAHAAPVRPRATAWPYAAIVSALASGAAVSALTQGPAETGLPQVAELYQRMPQGKVVNGWTTARFYSRFHLNLVEETVLAVVSDDFARGTAGRRWLEEDELLVRRRVHADMRAHLARSGLAG